jgi:hypothetical protein
MQRTQQLAQSGIGGEQKRAFFNVVRDFALQTRSGR